MSRLDELMAEYLPVFNDHQIIEDDEECCLTLEEAKTSEHFLYWCEVWGDDERGELAELLREGKQ